MHVGVPSKPLVSVGDEVKRGQRIGEAAGYISANIHASVSGTVKAVEPRPHPGGTNVMSVVIANDGKNETASGLTPYPIDALPDSKTIIQIVKDAGITGMGGAAFPTHVKIESSLGKVDTLLINAAECEPYITSDHRIMLEHTDEVLDGIFIIMKSLNLDSAILCIEDNKPDAIAQLRERLAEKKYSIKVLPMKTRYPQGAEKQLIYTATGREVPPGGLPAAVGCAVCNVVTARAVYQAVCLGEVVTDKVVTISGEAVKEPKNVLMPIGTTFQHIFDAVGGFIEDPNKVLMGGPMMGIAQYDLSVPIIKGTNAILALTKKDDISSPDPVCIRCGKCISVCPMHLMPVYLYMYQRKGNLAALSQYNVTDCIECGACSYVCPGKLYLTQSFKTGKAQLAAQKAAAQAAK